MLGSSVGARRLLQVRPSPAITPGWSSASASILHRPKLTLASNLSQLLYPASFCTSPSILRQKQAWVAFAPDLGPLPRARRRRAPPTPIMERYCRPFSSSSSPSASCSSSVSSIPEGSAGAPSPPPSPGGPTAKQPSSRTSHPGHTSHAHSRRVGNNRTLNAAHCWEKDVTSTSTAAAFSSSPLPADPPAAPPAHPPSQADDNVPPHRFRLDPSFVQQWEDEDPPFGFNGLGELVYRRTYSRMKADGEHRERWFETVGRVVNGTFSMQKEWLLRQSLEWDEERAQGLAQEMYRRIFEMKFLPPGRGLWAMGTTLTEDRRLYAALNNCGFVSTQDMANDPSAPFAFLMDASMLGVGVGFDTLGAGRVTVWGPNRRPEARKTFVIPDSREGWVESVKYLIDAYFLNLPLPAFDYSSIRPAGSPIKGFGGVSQGGEILEALHGDIQGVLDPIVGEPVSVTAIVDMMNLIGKCVVAGNVRRTAEIAFGAPEDEEYVDLKDYEKNPHRAAYGWTSNNSVFASVGMDYENVCERVQRNGEPGFAWLENMRAYGRMGSPPDWRDARAMGGNPCLEQTLESFELCCLVETFPDKHDSLEDFLATLQFAFLYAKTVTLGPTHWAKTNAVMLRNRRIGCSMSGLAQFVTRKGMGELHRWCEEGYQTLQEADQRYSEWLSIPRSVKTTSIKPSGTVSLLAGATPGMHFPESRFYLRRVRLAKNSELLPPLLEVGYVVEPAAGDPERTCVVEIPVDVGEGVRTLKEVGLWEQVAFAAFLQRHWADNQVSCTVTFDPATEGKDLARALDVFQYQLKGISFLPKMEAGAYPQMPYEEISEEEYRERTERLRGRRPDFWRGGAAVEDKKEELLDKFCESCSTNVEDRNEEK